MANVPEWEKVRRKGKWMGKEELQTRKGVTRRAAMEEGKRWDTIRERAWARGWRVGGGRDGARNHRPGSHAAE
jgi:hypothetical protein